jgi:hypothetical protein
MLSPLSFIMLSILIYMTHENFGVFLYKNLQSLWVVDEVLSVSLLLYMSVWISIEFNMDPH